MAKVGRPIPPSNPTITLWTLVATMWIWTLSIKDGRLLLPYLRPIVNLSWQSRAPQTFLSMEAQVCWMESLCCISRSYTLLPPILGIPPSLLRMPQILWSKRKYAWVCKQLYPHSYYFIRRGAVGTVDVSSLSKQDRVYIWGGVE